MLNHLPRNLRADQDPNPVGDQRDKSLSTGAQIRIGLFVNVDLSGDKEEIVADTV